MGRRVNGRNCGQSALQRSWQMKGREKEEGGLKEE